jgi:hypothetical protein
MLSKNNVLLLTIFIVGISCSEISKKNLAGTKWTNEENNIYFDFTSGNTVDIIYNGIIDEYIFYTENDKVTITNKSNYSQYIIEYKKGTLLFDSEIVKIMPKTIIKLHKTKEIPIINNPSDLRTNQSNNLPANQPNNIQPNQPENQPENQPNNLPANQPPKQPADLTITP